MSSLKDKNIIVTGASGGIGNSIVERLNQSGANILATGTRIEKLEVVRCKTLFQKEWVEWLQFWVLKLK